MAIHVKLYGVFKTAAGTDSINLDLLPAKPTVRMALTELVSRPGSDVLRALMLEGDSSDPRSTTLILVSGREIGALAGLDTELRNDDELSLLPIAHGG